jgi:hypothetical protein
MNLRHRVIYSKILKTTAVLLLLVISLFSYDRETHGAVGQGNSVWSIAIDGAQILTLILGVMVIRFALAFNKDIKRLSTRFGLPSRLPKISYEHLPLLLLPFLLIGTSRSHTVPVDQRSSANALRNSLIYLPPTHRDNAYAKIDAANRRAGRGHSCQSRGCRAELARVVRP